MKKFSHILKDNWQHIIADFFIGSIFGFLIIPLILKSSIIKNLILKLSSFSILAIFIGVFITILALRYKNLFLFLKRLKNNWKLENPPITIFEDLVISTLFMFVFFNLKFNEIYFDLYLSRKVLVLFYTFFLLIFFLFLLFISHLPEKADKEAPVKKGKSRKFLLFSDEPISHINQDILGRKTFIRNLKNQIIKFPFTHSFVIGLYGEWGEGKTSVLRLLRNELENKKNENKFILVEFDPWIFKDAKGILSNFYDTLWEEINRKYFFPDLKKFFNRYQNIISANLKNFPLALDLRFPEENIKTLKNKIDGCIKKLKRKIIIFIDDIDRLEPKEILLIFKFIKISVNFNNTIFILSFDIKKVRELLWNELNIDPEFIDKIIQQPINLPEIEQEDINRFLINSDSSTNYKCHIEMLFYELKIEERKIKEFLEKFKVNYMFSFYRIFRTLRIAKRYINSLKSSLPLVEKEVNLYDYFLLEIIKLFFIELYEDIYKFWWHYVDYRSGNELPFFSPLSSLDEEKKKNIIKEHCKNIIGKKEQDEKELFLELLCRLFPNVDSSFDKNLYRSENPDSEQRIASLSFLKYFIFRVPREEISDDIVLAHIKNWNELEEDRLLKNIKNVFNDFQKNKILIKLFDKMMIFSERIDKRTAEILVKSITHNSDSFTQVSHRGFDDSELSKAEFTILKLLSTKIDVNDIQSTIDEVIKSSTAIYLQIMLVNDIRANKIDFHRIIENVDLNNLKEKSLSMLKKHFIEDNRNIFEEVAWNIIICIWSSNFYSYDGTNYKPVNDYILSLVDSNPKYLGLIINEWRSRTEKESINLSEMAKCYDVDKLYKSILKYREKAFSNKEEDDAISIFIKLFKTGKRKT